MNDKKITFIMCVNDDIEFAEAKYYLERLIIPEGVEVEILAVTEAVSMAAGYNEGMRSTDAKYKVYMHQDVFIKNIHFVEHIIQIFQSDEKIGLLGVVGRKRLAEYMFMALDWDTGGVLHNCVHGKMEYFEGMTDVQSVEAVDGLLMATQYDLEWREDIFDKWDFYDVSQCMEFIRAGYRVVVPKQKDFWCYHDNTYSKLKNYFIYQERFINEYADIREFHSMGTDEKAIERELLLESLKSNLMLQMEQGKKTDVADVFAYFGNTRYLALRELEVISLIDKFECDNGLGEMFWKAGMCVQELIEKLHTLKYMIKRMEYCIQDAGEVMKEISGQYSVFAVAVVVNYYVGYKKFMITEVWNYYKKCGMEWDAQVWSLLVEQFSTGF